MTTILLPLPWLDEQLINSLSSKYSDSQAIVIHGMAGIGKNYLAHRLAKNDFLNNDEQSHQQLFDAATHPDYHVISSELNWSNLGKIERSQAQRYLADDFNSKKRLSNQISVESIRTLIQRLNESATMMGRKVVVITPAEHMNRNAANALLKSLEEPRANTKFILISHNLSSLLPTIRSRCLHIALPTPTKTHSAAWLRAQFAKCDETTIMAALRLAKSAPLLAHHYLNNDMISICHQLNWGLETLIDKHSNCIEISNNWLKISDLTFILTWLYDVLSEIIVFKLARKHITDTTILSVNQVTKFAKYYSRENLFLLLDYITISQNQSESVFDKNLLLEDILLIFKHPESLKHTV